MFASCNKFHFLPMPCFYSSSFSFVSFSFWLQIGGIVYVGVKFVNKFATVALLCVIFSIIAVYAGIFTNINGNDNLLWVLKLITDLLIYNEYSEWCLNDEF